MPAVYDASNHPSVILNDSLRHQKYLPFPRPDMTLKSILLTFSLHFTVFYEKNGRKGRLKCTKWGLTKEVTDYYFRSVKKISTTRTLVKAPQIPSRHSRNCRERKATENSALLKRNLIKKHAMEQALIKKSTHVPTFGFDITCVIFFLLSS